MARARKEIEMAILKRDDKVREIERGSSEAQMSINRRAIDSCFFLPLILELGVLIAERQGFGDAGWWMCGSGFVVTREEKRREETNTDWAGVLAAGPPGRQNAFRRGR